jgi:CRISPR-associated protein Csb2
MKVVLAIEIEFLTGVSVAAVPNRRDEAEWPPHPDRLFQALVASWGRNEPPDEEERRALEWMESLDGEGLTVSAPGALPRDVATCFVPPNDARTMSKLGAPPPKKLSDALVVLPQARKNRQPRCFPAVVPAAEPPTVTYSWKLDEEEARQLEGHRRPLERLAREVTYLGHSHTLVRVALGDADGDIGARSDDAVAGSLRIPHPGRFDHLRAQYARSLSENRIVRPSPSLAMRTFGIAQPPDVQTLFDTDNVTVFADASGFTPALDAFPLVAKRLRDALLECAPPDLPIPPLLSGCDATGQPTQEPHLSVIPLADVGWTHSHGRLMGLALVWPRTAAAADRRAALRAVARFVAERGAIGLQFGSGRSWSLALDPAPERASLRFDRYVRRARRWGTVLPAVLDRYPKSKLGHELADIIARACFHMGLPASAVDGLEVEVHKHAPLKGAPAVSEVLRCLASDSPYRSRPLAHLVLTFKREVCGPLILGAGRYRGLGLCLPLGDDRSAS